MYQLGVCEDGWSVVQGDGRTAGNVLAPRHLGDTEFHALTFPMDYREKWEKHNWTANLGASSAAWVPFGDFLTRVCMYIAESV